MNMHKIRILAGTLAGVFCLSAKASEAIACGPFGTNGVRAASGSIVRVKVGGVTYRLTVSPDKVVRLDGGTLTQEFLAGLPDGWTKSKLALVEGAFRGVEAEEMAKHDLRREIKREWSQAA